MTFSVHGAEPSLHSGLLCSPAVGRSGTTSLLGVFQTTFPLCATSWAWTWGLVEDFVALINLRFELKCDVRFAFFFMPHQIFMSVPYVKKTRWLRRWRSRGYISVSNAILFFLKYTDVFCFKSNESLTLRARWNVSSFCLIDFRCSLKRGPREDVSKGDDWNERKVIRPSLFIPFNKRYSDFFTSCGSSGWQLEASHGRQGCHCLVGSRGV